MTRKDVSDKKELNKCEFCLKPTHRRSTENTICSACDDELASKFLAEDLEVSTKHANKYKCQICSVGLPVTRRIKCFTCKPITLSENNRLEDDKINDSDVNYLCC